ncbi:hypothetical protein [Microbispora rosea]|uniref:hypothetical protein n=1 Tax=Microbispora rosea TaxID=58117 RepID=UPI003441EBD3
MLAVTLLALVVPGILWRPSDGEGPGFLAGMAVGGGVAIAVLAVMWLWMARRRS